MEFTIVAVSKLGDGICVAGIAESSDSYYWVRPTRQQNSNWRGLDKSDLYNYQGHGTSVLTKPGNVVRWEISSKMPAILSHVEDHLHPAGGVKQLEKQYTPGEFLNFLSVYEASEAAEFPKYLKQNLSMVLIKPTQIDSIYMDSSSIAGKYQPQISFQYNSKSYQYSVTDIDWFEFCSVCKQQGVFHNGIHRAFTNLFGVRIEYLILGLTQEFQGKQWPLIIGVVLDGSLPNNASIAKSLNRNVKSSVSSVESSKKPYNCSDCGRPLSHKGRCLGCNIKRKLKR